VDLCHVCDLDDFDELSVDKEDIEINDRAQISTSVYLFA
jgi:hypothetical protein